MLMISTLLSNKRPKSHSNLPAEPAQDAEEDAMAQARRRYEEELSAFQSLMNYNADVAYGIEPQNGTEE